MGADTPEGSILAVGTTESKTWHTQPMAAPVARAHLALLALFVAVLVWSGIRPHDYTTWALEIFPSLVGIAVILATYRRFRLTTLAYTCVLLHTAILAAGGHWTYALNPWFEWVKEAFGLARNHYDRLGHLAQGFFPALIAREIIARTSPLKRGRWLAFLVVCFCLAVSACYEFVEWWTALILGQGADAFLGTQGDPWDTQWDMFLALVGATLAMLTMTRVQDRALARVASQPPG